MILTFREVADGTTVTKPRRRYHLAFVAGVLIVSATGAAAAVLNDHGLSGSRRNSSAVVLTGRDRFGAERGAGSPAAPGLFETGACVAFRRQAVTATSPSFSTPATAGSIRAPSGPPGQGAESRRRNSPCRSSLPRPRCCGATASVSSCRERVRLPSRVRGPDRSRGASTP